MEILSSPLVIFVSVMVILQLLVCKAAVIFNPIGVMKESNDEASINFSNENELGANSCTNENDCFFHFYIYPDLIKLIRNVLGYLIGKFLWMFIEKMVKMYNEPRRPANQRFPDILSEERAVLKPHQPDETDDSDAPSSPTIRVRYINQKR